MELPAAPDPPAPDPGKEREAVCAILEQRNQQESRFLRLPTELRLKIYEYAIGEPGWVMDDLVDNMWLYEEIFNLTLVSRKVHTETVNLVTKLSTFVAIGSPRTVKQWVNNNQSIQPYITSMKRYVFLEREGMQLEELVQSGWLKEIDIFNTLNHLKHVKLHFEVYLPRYDEDPDDYCRIMDEVIAGAKYQLNEWAVHTKE